MRYKEASNAQEEISPRNDCYAEVRLPLGGFFLQGQSLPARQPSDTMIASDPWSLIHQIHGLKYLDKKNVYFLT